MRRRPIGHPGLTMKGRDVVEVILPDGLPRPRLRGWLHLGAVPFAVALGVALVVTAPGGRGTLAAGVYALTVIGVLLTSSLYHRGRWRPEVRAWWRRADRSMIFLLIAGTYTPLCLLVLTGSLATTLLVVVWVGAALGVALELSPWTPPRWLSVGLYLALGWVAVAAVPQLVDALGTTASLLALLGGLLYTAGAIVYGLRRPDPIPRVFGYHEIFHGFTLAAAAAHYAVIAFWVLPAAA
jgi:hemolysin III